MGGDKKSSAGGPAEPEGKPSDDQPGKNQASINLNTAKSDSLKTGTRAPRLEKASSRDRRVDTLLVTSSGKTEKNQHRDVSISTNRT